MLNILEKPWPTRAIRSEGSLKGILPHGMNSTRFPYMLMMSFSHEAQESPAKGFLVNMASSSFCYPPFDMMMSYRFLI